MAKTKLKGVRNTEPETVEETDSDEKIGLGARLVKLRDRFKLGPHHKMERFTVMLSSTLVFLLLFTGISFAGHQSKVATQLSVQSVFTTDFAYSLSKQTGKVLGVYGDENRQDVMVLFQMADPSSMSADAANYEVFITGEKDPLAYKPDVSFALFGSTGYGMIRFQHDSGMANEVIDVIIRSKSSLTATSEVAEEELTDASFGKFDQAKIYVNPGADQINVFDAIEPGEDDPSRLYAALVAETKDAELRTKIAESTKTIGTAINQANEYSQRLVASGYEPPETPWFIEDDYVDDDGMYRPAKYLLGAHKVDYAENRLLDGYINQVADGLAGYDDYMTAHAIRVDKAKDDDMTPPEDVPRITTIERDDGSMLDLDKVTTGKSPTNQVSAKDSLESLRGVWQTHLSAKRTIQMEMMLALLLLDADVLSQPSLYSEASGEKTVFFY